jgi:queuine tRNA-ribosyltransferase
VDQRMHLLSPERSVEVQSAIGSDIMMVLDECIDSTADEARVAAAMHRTHRWALRSLAARRDPERALFAIVQGGVNAELRRESAEFLTAHPFDGFAIGGLAVGDTRADRERITALAAELLPADRPRYLMGVGTPPDLLSAMLAGVDMFDCVLPTRNGRTGQAFTSRGRLNIKNAQWTRDLRPLDEMCACGVCRRHSRAYLRHLYMTGEMLASILLTHHNLAFFLDTMRRVRQAIRSGDFTRFRREFLEGVNSGVA